MFRSLGLTLVFVGACGVENVSDPIGPDPTTRDGSFDAPEANAGNADRRFATLWQTCGDPVCRGWIAKGLPRCGPHVAGGRCFARMVGQECDPVDACNTTLMCDFANPIGSGACPISRAAFKRDITYLSLSQADALYGDLRDVKLAKWIYKDDVTGAPHTGFIIDDMVSGSPAVTRDGDHVDLYGYTSMTVAAVQAQARRIDALEKEIAELKALVKAQASHDTPAH
jgi:hypothetical protein